jgi:hypothetical protein
MSIMRMSELAATRAGGADRLAADPGPPTLPSSPGSAVLSAIKSIVDYIPTEIITVYVAVTAAISDAGSSSRAGQWAVFWVFLILTPATLWALTAGRLRASGAPLPLDPKRWPWPELSVATIAYVLWAFTLPAAPFADLSWYRPGLGAAVLLVGTLVLGLGAPLFARAPTSPAAGG